MQRSVAIFLVSLVLVVVSLVVASPGPARGPSDTAAAAKHRQPLSCPANYRRPQFQHGPTLRHRLIPAGATKLIACRYHGLNTANPHTLAGSSRIQPGPALDRVVGLFNELRKPPKEPLPCPADLGKDIVVHVRFADRPDVPVEQQLDGCRFATNGPLTRWAEGHKGSVLVHLLRTLTASHG